MTTTNVSTTKRYCACSGKWCEFANLQGFCTVTACCKRVIYDDRTTALTVETATDTADTPQTEQWHYDEKDNTWYPYQHKSCATCKHALGNWDEESNNCGRCCGADRRFYEPIEDEQTERSE